MRTVEKISHLPGSGNLPLLALLLIIGTVVVGTITYSTVKEWREKDKIATSGEVAAARVVEQRVVQRGPYSYNEITYEFSLANSHLIRKTQQDHTRQFFEDMLITVFYDPASPQNCTALCATYYRLPDKEN